MGNRDELSLEDIMVSFFNESKKKLKKTVRDVMIQQAYYLDIDYNKGGIGFDNQGKMFHFLYLESNLCYSIGDSNGKQHTFKDTEELYEISYLLENVPVKSLFFLEGEDLREDYYVRGKFIYSTIYKPLKREFITSVAELN